MEGSGVLRMRRQHKYVNQAETRDTEETNEFKRSSKKKKPALWDEKADVCLFEFLFVAKRSQLPTSLLSSK